MPRNYVKKKVDPPYSAEDLKNAVRDVQNKNMTLKGAAMFYNVPKSTIYDRLSGKGTDQFGAGRPLALGTDVEQEIADCLVARASLGVPCSREELKELIQKYVENNNIVTPFINNKPGQDWYLAFMKRHPSLTLKKAEHIQKARTDARDPEVVFDFFEMLQKLYEEKGMNDKPDFIFNCDESGFSHDPTRWRGIGQKGAPLSRISGGSGKENTSVLACVSADGNYMPPLIIFKGAAVQGRWISKEAYPGTVYAASTKGYMEEPVFFSWLTDSFIPFVKKLREQNNLPHQHAVLVYDGHSSHYSIRIIKAARDSNISLVKLPSHITDKMQPLDKCVFGPLKNLWEPELVKYAQQQVGHGPGRLTKELFGKHLGRIWPNGMKKANIQSGFKSTGIFPIDPKKVGETLFTELQLQSYNTKKARCLKRSAAFSSTLPAPPTTKTQRVEEPGLSSTTLKDSSTPLTLEESFKVVESASNSPLPQHPLATAGPIPQAVGIITSTQLYGDKEDSIEAKALDLSTKIHGSTPEKPISLIDIFASKIKYIPKKPELSTLKLKTPEQIARLKNLKYGEVLTTDEVLKRLEEAQEAKEKKKMPKKAGTTKRVLKGKEESDEEDPDEGTSALPNLVDTSDEYEEQDEEDHVFMDDFSDLEAGSKARLDDFVLVQFKKQSPKEAFVFYIGKVTEIQGIDLFVTFLRKKNPSFIFPNVPDISPVSKTDIKKVLPVPSVRRGYYSFNIIFPSDIKIL